MTMAGCISPRFWQAIAVGSKSNAALAFAVIAPLILFQVLRRGKLRLVVAGTVAFSLLALPTYLLVYSFTGNPVFPLLNGLFRSPKWEFENTAITSEFGIGTTFSALVRFPFRLTFDTARFGEASPGV